MGNATIFTGNSEAKVLADIFDINGKAKIISGSVNPSSVAVSANAGSIYLNTSGLAFVKIDNGSSTNWKRIGSIATVASITALKALDKTIFSCALMSGYYAANDGGAGTFIYDSSDVVSTDNGGTVIVATDGGRWKLVQADTVAVCQFGAKGDNVTNDSAAFTAYEAVFSNRKVDLNGKTYLVTAEPMGNRYMNGFFSVAKSVTVGGVVDNYTWTKRAVPFTPSPAGNNLYRDARVSRAANQFTLTQVNGFQGFAIDEVARKIFTLHVTGTAPEVSWISEYAMGTSAATAATGVSNSNGQLGHQGLSLEYINNGNAKLWGSVRYDAALYPNGGRQAIRFDYAGNALDITNIQVYTLFDSSFSYTTNSTIPAVSFCQRFLVAIGRKGSREFYIRVFDLNLLIAGGAGDYSTQFLYEFQVDRAIIGDDSAGNFRPVQGLACDGASVYILSGNSGLTTKRIDRYTLEGRFEQTESNISVGQSEATAEGTFYEPEALGFYRPDFTAQPALVMCVVSAGAGAHINRFWALGYNRTITESLETLVSGRWTPTLTNGTNVAASTAASCHYSRIGNTVHFSGRVSIDATATGQTNLEMSLPIPSNFTSLTDATGCFACNVTVDCGGIEGSVANDRLVFGFIASDTANRPYYFSGMYQIK